MAIKTINIEVTAQLAQVPVDANFEVHDLSTGNVYVVVSNAWTLKTLTGPVGPVGPKGDTGSQGIQGIQGVAGPTGATGGVGPAGPQGDTGATGIAGASVPVTVSTSAPSGSPSATGALWIMVAA